MPDAFPPVAVAHLGGPPAAAAVLGTAAMSIDDYARVVQARTEFVDFLLAPVRGQLAAAA
ncbi:hypothetical protein [Kocuria sabuli]|uniref:hypothetical protein n=1 Tax=Kocuria sabuli TaxID=3071448 RepID=UPI0034D3DC3E